MMKSHDVLILTFLRPILSACKKVKKININMFLTVKNS